MNNTKLFVAAKWIWLPKVSRLNNVYACFRKTFTLKSPPKSAPLNITADSRYEVFVNGQWLGHGPARAFHNPWPVDQYDIAHLLKPGKNVIAILVHHIGISTFQYIHSDKPGVIAEAQIDRLRIATDKSWKCIEHTGYAWPTPHISCQQGWEEQFDARIAPGAPHVWSANDFDDRKWPSARIAPSDHKEFEPRDIPFLTRQPIEPVAVKSVEAVRSANYSFRLDPRDFLNAADRTANHLRGNMLLVLHIDSPKAQELQLHNPHGRPEAQWKLNGQPVTFNDFSKQLTDTGIAKEQLKKGRNVLMVSLPEIEHPWWATINLWAAAPLKLSPWLSFGPFKSTRKQIFDTIIVDPSPEFPGATRELFSAAWERGDLTKDDLAQPFARALTKDMVCTTDIYAQCASERIDPKIKVQIDEPAALLDDNENWTTIHPVPENVGARMLLDFGQEVVGYHEFEIDAPAGTILDNHNFEFIQRDGRFNLAEGMNNSFRYICREGVQRYRTFIRRGFRYSWFTLRNFNRPVRIRFVRMLMSTYPQTGLGDFACSDTKLDAIWKAGVLSVRCCSEDTYTDCPTYEQTYWVGDARNEALVDLIANGDARLSAHCLRLAGRSLDRSPVVESQVPSGWQNLLPTWSFLWMRWIEEHYQFTGDKKFAREMLRFIDRNMKGVTSNLNDKGLFQLFAWNLFDWAGMDTPAGGCITHLNCFIVLALRQCADLARQLNDNKRADSWIKLADDLTQRINQHLWSNEKNAYVDCIRPDGTPSPAFSQQTHTAAYISGVADGERSERCREIVHNPPPGFVTTGSPFFMFFLLEALVREKNWDSLVETIRNYWGQQVDAGATTFWEMFHPEEDRLTRSHCHGWSAAPVVFLTQHVLGVQSAAPGYSQILIAPKPGGLTWAHGHVPTPHGTIECYWKDEPEIFTIRVYAPAGIPIRINLPYTGRITIDDGAQRGAEVLGPSIKMTVMKIEEESPMTSELAHILAGP